MDPTPPEATHELAALGAEPVLVEHTAVETPAHAISNPDSMIDEPYQLVDNNGNSVSGDEAPEPHPEAEAPAPAPAETPVPAPVPAPANGEVVDAAMNNPDEDEEAGEYTVVPSTDDMDDEMREAIEEQREINRRQSAAEQPLYPRDEDVVQKVKLDQDAAWSKPAVEPVRASVPNSSADLTGFADSLAEELSCPICAELLNIPVTLIPCLHTFCSSCITTWFTQAPRTVATTSCPLCKVRCKATRPNPAISALIEKTLQYHVPKGLAELEECMREIEAAKDRQRAAKEAAERDAALLEPIPPVAPVTPPIENEPAIDPDAVVDPEATPPPPPPPPPAPVENARPDGLVTIEEYTPGEERPDTFPVPGLHPISANGETRIPLSLSLFVRCDVCERDHIEFERHYHCGQCNGNEYDVCLDCYRKEDGSGRKCRCDETEVNESQGRRGLVLRRYDRQSGRLETGVFCDSCDKVTNELYWHCRECANNDFDFCNACVKQGFHCTHPLVPKECTILDIIHPINYTVNLYVRQNSTFRHRFYDYYCFCDICTGDMRHPLRYWHCGSPECKTHFDYDICEGCKAVLDESEEIAAREEGRPSRDKDLCPKGHPMALLQLDGSGRRTVIYSAASGRTRGLAGAPPREMEVDREGVDLENRPMPLDQRAYLDADRQPRQVRVVGVEDLLEGAVVAEDQSPLSSVDQPDVEMGDGDLPPPPAVVPYEDVAVVNATVVDPVVVDATVVDPVVVEPVVVNPVVVEPVVVDVAVVDPIVVDVAVVDVAVVEPVVVEPVVVDPIVVDPVVVEAAPEVNPSPADAIVPEVISPPTEEPIVEDIPPTVEHTAAIVPPSLEEGVVSPAASTDIAPSVPEVTSEVESEIGTEVVSVPSELAPTPAPAPVVVPRRSTADVTTKTYTMTKSFFGEPRRGELEIPINGKVVGVQDIAPGLKSGWFCGKFGLFRVDEDEVMSL